MRRKVGPSPSSDPFTWFRKINLRGGKVFGFMVPLAGGRVQQLFQAWTLHPPVDDEHFDQPPLKWSSQNMSLLLVFFGRARAQPHTFCFKASKGRVTRARQAGPGHTHVFADLRLADADRSWMQVCGISSAGSSPQASVTGTKSSISCFTVDRQQKAKYVYTRCKCLQPPKPTRDFW